MTPTERKYFYNWSAICRIKGWKSGDDSKRHAMHMMALGVHKSHKDFKQADWDRVFNTMATLSDSIDLDATVEQIALQQHDAAQATHVPEKRQYRLRPTRYDRMTPRNDPGERRRLEYVLNRLYDPIEVADESRSRFDTAEWHSLDIPRLTELRDAMNNRLGKFLTGIKKGTVRYDLKLALHNHVTGLHYSNADLIKQLLRRGIPVRMNQGISLPEQMETPF